LTRRKIFKNKLDSLTKRSGESWTTLRAHEGAKF
jgi:hypothetical protein